MIEKSRTIVRSLINTLGYDLRRLPRWKPQGFSYSYLDEQNIIESFLRTINSKERYCVDIAASDGIVMSNTYALFKKGWGGLAVERDSASFASLALNYADFPSVNLAKCMVMPTNVLDLLAAHMVPLDFEFLNLDIDGYDYFVLEQILTKYRPKLICTEINEKIPPPIKFTVAWNPQYQWAKDHFFGQSIAKLETLYSRHQYSLVEIHYNNAFLIPAELSPGPSLDIGRAFQEGYANMSDRRQKFPWNSDVEELLHLSPEDGLAFINRIFSKYAGYYEASI